MNRLGQESLNNTSINSNNVNLFICLKKNSLDLQCQLNNCISRSITRHLQFILSVVNKIANV